MSVIAIIPARFGSTRLPGKPLARIGAKPMIQHVYENVVRVKALDRTLVATDDERIAQTVRGFGGDVMMTAAHHVSGTDRLAEVARKIRAEWVVNVQGDLPFIQPATISRAVRPLQRNRSLPMATVCTPISDEVEWRNPNVVKVVMDERGFALYFSRSPMPYVRNDGAGLNGNGSGNGHQGRLWGFKHLGLYVYRRDFLLKFARLRPSALERVESLEQLRALSYGYKIYVTKVDETSIEIDTPDDLVQAEAFLRRRDQLRAE